MNLTEALEQIGKALGVLTLQVRAENLSGLFSKNRLMEDLLLPVFQLALKAPNLRNLNQDQLNFPCIDLGDDRFRLAIQVTTERDAAKVTETLTNFLSLGYQKTYKRLVFFILTGQEMHFTSKTKLRWKKICGKKFKFEPERDIITTLDLFPLIAGLPHPDVFAVYEIVARSLIGEAYVDVESYLDR
jgi:hypothetical protein